MTEPRPFHVEFDRAHTTVTAYLSGDLDVMVVGLAERIIECMDDKTKRVVLDATDLTFCDSTGLGQFVEVAAFAAKVGAEVSLYQPSFIVAEAMRVTGIDQVVPVRCPQKRD